MSASLAIGLSSPMRSAPEKPLRFLTCGSVDDGKSTLIGRLLWDTGSLKADQRAAIAANGEPDFARALDGLEAEREQGITIDVAWRYFSSARRAFIVADTPGHVQYTRNMATGASQADASVILVDARLGVLEQTRRHASIVALMGVGATIFAVNKMDLVDHSRNRFEEIRHELALLARRLGLEDAIVLPLSALKGENLTRRAPELAWYAGPTLLEALEDVAVTADRADAPFRFPVQRVARPDASFRGYQGTLAAGSVRPGDVVVSATSGMRACVARIVAFDGDRPRALAGDAVTLTLDREIDLARGDLLAAPAAEPAVVETLGAELVALDNSGVHPGRRYVLQCGGRAIGAFAAVQSAFDLAAGEWTPAADLPVNGIGRARLLLDAPMPLDCYADNRTTGSFILIDPIANATIAAGMVRDLADGKNAVARPTGEKARVTLVLLDGDAHGLALPVGARVIETDRAEIERRLFGLWGDNI